jgi:hypothetical protein
MHNYDASQKLTKLFIYLFNTILLLKYTFVIKAQNSSDGLIVRFLV